MSVEWDQLHSTSLARVFKVTENDKGLFWKT